MTAETLTAWQRAAKELAEAFTSKRVQRAGESEAREIVVLCDGSERGDWRYDAVLEAHQGALPDDWTFQACREVADALDESEAEDRDDAEEALTEAVDGLIDVYHSALLRWVATAAGAPDDVGDALDEYGSQKDFYTLLQYGQAQAYNRIGAVLLAAIEARADEIEEEEDTDQGEE